MRRTARALSAAVLASAVLGVFPGPVSADPGAPQPPTGAGSPAAEVSPADAAPGGTVTVSVTCAPTGGSAPATLDATSPAFDEGTVALRKVAGDEGAATGPAYRGTARIAAAEDFESEPEAEGSEDAWTVDGACPGESGAEGDPWSTTMTVPQEPVHVPEEAVTVPEEAVTVPEQGSGAVAPPCPEPTHSAKPGGQCGGTEPVCPETTVPHGESAARGTSCTTKPPCPEPVVPGKSCGGGTAEHGVRAGAGGAFTDSMPALVAGGVLIAGAFGAAAHRLRLRLRGDAGHR
ncbi:hypothetical protein [Streptomyces pactum]|uniref:Secreted protein n=1 Tax=Streptomyces pactum TaxID=68249 RepID=A0A1S6J4G5_9ACTN|nr:hypothetical protein [Streptomyces pactum]AQS66620.1 hypothetical protein B1H29_06510 [Streptomyces pactum]